MLKDVEVVWNLIPRSLGTKNGYLLYNKGWNNVVKRTFFGWMNIIYRDYSKGGS